MCLPARISDKIPNLKQKQVLQKKGLGLEKIVFDLEDTEEEVHGKLTNSKILKGLSYYGVYLTVEYWKALKKSLYKANPKIIINYTN